MPAPPSSNALTLGRPVIDLSLIKDPGTRIVMEQMLQMWMGQGCPAGARSGDTQYQAVYAQPDGMGAHILYGGKPADPMNPDVLTVSASGSATVIWQEEGVTAATYGTVNFVGSNVTVTDGGTKAIVTITGGSGGTYTAGNGIDIDGSNVVSAELATNRGLEFDGSGIAVSIGDGLEMSTNDIVVKAHTYIDVTSDGVAVDFTEVASYSGAGDQYLRNNAGTFEWATLPPDTNTTYTAGAGINLSGTKFVADPHDASHVGLVDPTTGDDSTADDAQIGILWHEIQSFDNGRNQLYGHIADDPDKPKVTAKMTEDWLELLEDYSEVDRMVIGSDPDAAEEEGDEKVKWIPSPQKVLWCIDPDGGHTITTTGTTLTLTLKVTKYTFDAVNFVSAVDADVEIEYTGTECA